MSEAGDARASASPDAGTTLIEALVVVAVTTTTALIGFPRLQQQLLDSAQHRTVAVVAAHLREAQAAALRLDRAEVFAVARDGHAYGSPATGAAAVPTGVRLTVQLVRPAGIVFYGDGSSSGGVVWVRAARRASALLVSPDSGAVAVETK